jgi:hypothetical protein
MESWIFLHMSIEWWVERWISNYKQVFDAWEDGGVRGLAVGRLRFQQEDGSFVRAFAPDAKIYEAFGLAPPPEEPREPEKEKKLHEILDNAAARGWEIMIFDVPGGGKRLVEEEDPYNETLLAAGTQDVLNAFPQASGVILDGPGEQHYELAWHHGGKLFELRPHERELFGRLGCDIDRMEAGIAHLQKRCQSLTPDLVRYHSRGGTLAGLLLFDIDENGLYWLRARQEAASGSMAAARRAVDRVDKPVKLGGIPRITTFSSLTGQNYQQMPQHFDYIFPKHYYWHRGFDGMYGTIQRWVQKFAEWNPSLTEPDCFQLIESLFGLQLPNVSTLLDLERGFPEEFFTKVVYGETRRALAAIGDVDKTIFWVSTGRYPHAGDAMPARDLQGILQATKDGGGKRILFHPDPEIGAPEWHVLSRMCGNPWREDPDGYWPGDTWREDVEGYGAHFQTSKSKVS